MIGDLIPYLAPTVVLLLILASAIKILPEYERGVVFFLGRFQGVKGPGLIIVIPGIQQIVRVDLRVITLDVPSQDVISRDNVTVRVNAVLYFRVVDPERAIIRVEDFNSATSQLAQTTLRSVLGKHDLDEMLSERDKLNSDIQEIIDAQTEEWGIKVANVEIKHVDLNESMIRAIARQAEAERERRAKVIHAEGELQASKKLVEAADVMSTNSGSMQLRYLQTLADMSNTNSSTIVFPLPMELITTFLKDNNLPALTSPIRTNRIPGHKKGRQCRPFRYVSALLLAGTLEHTLGTLVCLIGSLLGCTSSGQGFFRSLLGSAGRAGSAVSGVQCIFCSALSGAGGCICFVDGALVSGGTTCSQSSGQCNPGDRQFTHCKSPYWSSYFL